MPRYIDADALRDALYDADAITMHGVRILNQFPTIDPESLRARGKWNLADSFTEWFGRESVCSVCGGMSIPRTDYCPSCGAKMEVSK